MTERALGRIVAHHMTLNDGEDVANSRHLDPERPPVVVLHELEDQHDHGVPARKGGSYSVDPKTGNDVFTPWPDAKVPEEERTRRLAKEALARMDQHLPPGASERKGIPLATGCFDYFPDALAAVATLSRIGNDQHNPGTPLHWDREKSADEDDCLLRHFVDRGSFDNDGVRHRVKVAWRALAGLQKEIEDAKAKLEPVFK